MEKGLYRAYRPDLGEECARIDVGDIQVEAFLTRTSYVARGNQPFFDDLPTEEEYLRTR